MMDPQIRRELEDLRAARIGTIGEVDLATQPDTSTTVTTRTCSESSVVRLTPLNGAAIIEGEPLVTPTKGSFTITHSPSFSTRTYRWVVLNNINARP